MAKTRRVLMVTYGGGHVALAIPVKEELERRGGYEVEFLALTTAGPALARKGIPSLGFRDFLRPEDAEARARGEELAGTQPAGLVPREETVAYMGLSYQDLVTRLGAEEAARRFAERGRQCFLPITVLERILAERRPDLVMTTNSPRAEQAAILAAGRLGIPAVCVVDLFGLWEVEWMGKPDYADRICVLGEFVRGILLEAGRDPGDVVITGNPAFDRLADPSLAEAGRRLRTELGWEDKTVILWASQPEPDDPELPRRIDSVVLDAVARHPDWALLIRPHPSEDVDFGELPPRVALSTSADPLDTALHASDLVLTMTSTVGLEGVMLGRPMVACDFSQYTPDVPFTKHGLATGVESLEEIEEGIVRALAAPVPDSGIPLGTSARRVADVLVEVMDARER